MIGFITRRLGMMLLTMLCLTLVVFFMVNLGEPAQAGDQPARHVPPTSTSKAG